MPAPIGAKTGKGTAFPKSLSVGDLSNAFAAKLDEVTALLDKLRIDLEKHNLTPNRKTCCPSFLRPLTYSIETQNVKPP